MLLKFYRGWKVVYLPIAGEYRARKGNLVLEGKNRVEIEREVDKLENKVDKLMKELTRG